jgi:tetratricopeptide (TPR) repeat protein
MRNASRRLKLACALLLAVTPALSPAQAPSDSELQALNQRVNELYRAGKNAEALPLVEQAVKIAEQLQGPNDPAVVGPLLMLGEVLDGLGRLPEAEPFEKRALSIRRHASQ